MACSPSAHGRAEPAIGTVPVITSFSQVTRPIDPYLPTVTELRQLYLEQSQALTDCVAQAGIRTGPTTPRDAVYLRDALDAYSTCTRRDEPEVARHVFFDTDPLAGVCVLTRGQADDLARQLEAANPRGVNAVRLRTRGDQGPIELEIGGSAYSLPAASSPRVRLSPTLVAGVGLALFTLTLSDPEYGAQALHLTVPLAVLALAYGVASHALTRRLGSSIEPWLAVGALTVFAVDAVGVARFAAAVPSGRGLLLDILPGLALVLGTARRPWPAVAVATIGLCVAIAVALGSFGRPPDRYVLAELTWTAVAFAGAQLTTGAIDRLGRDLSEMFRRERQALVTAARTAAGNEEVAFVLDVLDQSEQLCRQAELEPVRDLVARDLEALRLRLNLYGGQPRFL